MPKTPPKLNTATFVLEEAQIEALRGVAQALDMSASKLVRTLVGSYLGDATQIENFAEDILNPTSNSRDYAAATEHARNELHFPGCYVFHDAPDPSNPTKHGPWRSIKVRGHNWRDDWERDHGNDLAPTPTPIPVSITTLDKLRTPMPKPPFPNQSSRYPLLGGDEDLVFKRAFQRALSTPIGEDPVSTAMNPKTVLNQGVYDPNDIELFDDGPTPDFFDDPFEEAYPDPVPYTQRRRTPPVTTLDDLFNDLETPAPETPSFSDETYDGLGRANDYIND
jgi:hypothetical protein